MKTFKVGDKVRFKSGGPVMSIKSIFADGESIICEIREAGNATEVGPYPFDILMLETMFDNKSTGGKASVEKLNP